MQRREFVKLAAYGAAGLAMRPAAASPRFGKILDGHIHLFDPTRPGGVPWPTKDNAVLYKPALPERYEAVTAGFGVVGAIAIEASDLPADNEWLLDVVRRHPVMVGAIGDLDPAAHDYMARLEKLHRDPLFLGIRYGNLWDRDLAVDIAKPGFVDGLKALAQAGLVLESANPDARLIHAILEVAEKVPGLTIAIDHLPHAPVPTEAAARDAYWSDLGKLAEHPRVFVKLSEIPVRRNDKLITDPGFYREALDRIWDVFGEDRIYFGSDWPNSDTVAPFAETMSIVRGYVGQKSEAAQEKYFWKNSIAVYKWKPRRANQGAE
jgi:predicted TIM-barrel fold metal-dependent hydrolase